MLLHRDNGYVSNHDVVMPKTNAPSQQNKYDKKEHICLVIIHPKSSMILVHLQDRENIATECSFD